MDDKKIYEAFGGKKFEGREMGGSADKTYGNA